MEKETIKKTVVKKDTKESTKISKKEKIEVEEVAENEVYTQHEIEDKEDVQEKIYSLASNKKVIVALVALIAVLIFMIVFFMSMGDSNEPKVTYTVEQALKGTINNTISSEGVLKSSTVDVVTSKVSAVVKEVHYKKGDVVKKDTTLITLDTSFANSEIAKIDFALLNYKAFLETYKQKQTDLNILSPYTGFIQGIKVKNDQEISAGDIVAYIRPTTTFKAEFAYTYSLDKKIELWQTVKVAANEGEINGIVDSIEGELKEGSTIKVIVLVTNSKFDLSGKELSSQIKTISGDVNSNGNGKFFESPLIPIYSKQSGIVRSMNLKEGMLIDQNSTLFTLDNKEISSKITELEAKVNQLKQNSEYYKFDLNNYIVKSKIDGKIESDPMNIGDTVSPNQVLASIRGSESIKVEALVSAASIDDIAIGQEAELIIPDAILGKLVIKGQVTDKETRRFINDSTENYKVTITVINDSTADASVLDKDVKVEIILNKKENAIYVPVGALDKQGDYTYVNLATDNGTVKRPVRVGIVNGQFAEIIEGVAEGEKVYVATPVKK